MKRILQKSIAAVSFAVAVALAFTSILISEDNDIPANVYLAIVLFLTLTAALLGIDYKFTQYGKEKYTTGSRPQEQQPTEHS